MPDMLVLSVRVAVRDLWEGRSSSLADPTHGAAGSSGPSRRAVRMSAPVLRATMSSAGSEVLRAAESRRAGTDLAHELRGVGARREVDECTAEELLQRPGCLAAVPDDPSRSCG